MKRTKLTLDALSEMYDMLNVLEQEHVVGGGSGTSTDPYTLQEVDPLIDNGTFAGGYVKDENGLVSYWMGVANIYADSSSDTDNEEFLDSCSDFWNEWEGSSVWWGYSESGSNSDDWSNMTSSMSGDGNWPYFGDLADGADFVSSVGDAIGENAGKTRIGSNGKFYFETRNGRVFYGNKYVGTTSLTSFGMTIGKYAEGVSVVISVYNVVATYENEGPEAAGEELVTTAGGMAGGMAAGWAGAKLGACVGSWAGPAGAAIGGVVGGIIGGVAGSMAGEYIVEIGLQ